MSRPPEEAVAQVLDLAVGCAALHHTPPPTVADLKLTDARGPGHGVPSTEGLVAADLALRTEGLVLDPVYSAKALGALTQLLLVCKRFRDALIGTAKLVTVTDDHPALLRFCRDPPKI